jgi:LmbE family N-acetylglucosaminyl deacetylase
VRTDVVTVIDGLGHAPLALPSEAELRELFVARIRALRPDVVLAPAPPPRLLQHPAQRRVARAAMDAAWPYAASALGDGEPYQVNEAWLFATLEPDLFVRVGVPDDEGRVTDSAARGEEGFAQVDLRARAA